MELIPGTSIEFRTLTVDQEASFRKFAQDNDPSDLNNWLLYHPVCRDEWEKRGIVAPPPVIPQTEPAL